MPTPISTARPPRAPAIRSAGQTSAARPPRRPSRRPPTPEPNPESDSESNSESDTIPYEETTDRTLVDKPVDAATHNDMSQAWEITQYFQMCILFDAINPLRQFKRGTEFNEDDADPFPVYNPRDHADLTESDEEGILQPYKPSDYTYVQLLCLFVPLSLTYAHDLQPPQVSVQVQRHGRDVLELDGWPTAEDHIREDQEVTEEEEVYLGHEDQEYPHPIRADPTSVYA